MCELFLRSQYTIETLRFFCTIASTFRRSSVVEQLTVNQLVAGSNPAAGADITFC